MTGCSLAMQQGQRTLCGSATLVDRSKGWTRTKGIALAAQATSKPYRTAPRIALGASVVGYPSEGIGTVKKRA